VFFSEHVYNRTSICINCHQQKQQAQQLDKCHLTTEHLLSVHTNTQVKQL